MPGTHTGVHPALSPVLSLTPAHRTAFVPHLHPAQVNRGRSQVQGHPGGEGRCSSGCHCAVETSSQQKHIKDVPPRLSSQWPGWAVAWPPGKNRLRTRWAALPLPERKAESDRGAWLAFISQLLEEEMKAAINCTRRVVCAA